MTPPGQTFPVRVHSVRTEPFAITPDDAWKLSCIQGVTQSRSSTLNDISPQSFHLLLLLSPFPGLEPRSVTAKL
jgi:hypothetical protein